MGTRHSFAPLKSSNDTTNVNDDRMQLKGIVFDMDGTLCEPQNYMFGQMRAAISIPANEDILDHIYSLSAAKQDEAFAKIQAIEREAMAKQVPQPGVRELMRFLDQRGVRKAICTRNFDAPVFHFLTTHLPSSSSSISLPFSPIITRDFRPPKPHPAGILHIASQWGIPTPTLSASSEDTASERRLPPRPQPLLPIIMVGDSVDDMAAGRDAGALTVLLRSEGKEDLEGDARVDVVVGRLDELVGLLEEGLEVRRREG